MLSAITDSSVVFTVMRSGSSCIDEKSRPAAAPKVSAPAAAIEIVSILSTIYCAPGSLLAVILKLPVNPKSIAVAPTPVISVPIVIPSVKVKLPLIVASVLSCVESKNTFDQPLVVLNMTPEQLYGSTLSMTTTASVVNSDSNALRSSILFTLYIILDYLVVNSDFCINRISSIGYINR